MSLLKPYIIDELLCSGEVCDKETLFAGVAVERRNWRECYVWFVKAKQQQEALAKMEKKIKKRINGQWEQNYHRHPRPRRRFLLCLEREERKLVAEWIPVASDGK